MLHVLYVDDDPTLLKLGKTFLEATASFAVDTLPSANNALAVIPDSEYDAIVSDYQMPGMDGIEFLKSVRASGNTIPFILFTGRGREEVVIQALNEGADFYLQKGGEPRSQFAELAHKIQQSVAKRKAEQSLIDSEKRLSDIINFLPDATFAIDRTGSVIAWNRAIEEMTGIPAAEMLGKGDHEYSIPFYGTRRKILIDLVFESDDIIAENYANIIHEKDVLIADTTLPRPRGNSVTLMGKASPLYDQKGEIVGAIESIRDITEKKQAEDAIKESERRFRELSDLLPQVVFECDSKGTLKYANQIAFDLFGYDPSELDEGLSVLHMIIPEDRERARIALSGVLEGKSPASYDDEYRALRKDGSTFSISIYNSPIIAHGMIVGLRGIIVDITSRKQADEELRAAHEQLAASEEELRGQFDELCRNEQMIRESESRLRYMLGFYEMVRQPEKDIMAYALEGAGTVTGSPLGYLAFLNEEETELSMYAWSKTAMEECSMREKPIIYPVEKTGLWGEAVRQRRAVITNDYSAPNPKKKGYPDGHPRIVRHMNIPIFDGTHIVIVAGVANRPTDYSENEVRQLTLLMQELWQVLKRRRAEDQLRQSEEKFRNLAELLPQIVFEMDKDFTITFVNRRGVKELGYSSDEMMIGFNALSFIDPSQHDRVGQNLRNLVDGIPYENREYMLIRHDGSTFPALIYADPVYRRGELAGFRGIVVDITKRKKVETALVEREASITSIFRAAPTGIGVVVNRVITQANDRLCDLTGYTGEELVGKNARILYPTDKEYEFVGREKYDQIRMTGTGTVETRWQRKDGTIRDILLSSTPIDPADHGKGITFTALDITEQRQAEHDLREANETIAASEEELRSQFEELTATQDILKKQQDQLTEVANMVPGVVFQFYARDDGTRGLYYISGRAPEIFGFPDEVDDFYAWFIAHVDERDRADFLRSVDEVIRTASPWNFEGRFIKPSGERIWFQGMSRAVRRGNELVFNGVMLDINDRKQTELAIRENEQKYRTLVETTDTGFVIIDGEGCVLDANPEYIRLTGNTRLEQIVGRNVTEWTVEDELEKNAAAVRQCMREGFIRNLEIDYRDVSGAITPIEINATVLQTSEGPHILTLCRDITRRKQAEEELRKGMLITESIPTGLHLYHLEDLSDDRTLRMVYANPAVESLTGLAPAAIVGRTLDENFPGLRAQGIPQRYAEVVRSQNPVTFEDIVYGDDRIPLAAFSVKAFPLPGNMVGVAFENITDRKTAEETLRESEEKYRTVVEQSNDAVFIAQDGLLVFHNPAFAAMTGYPDMELRGCPIRDLIAPEDLDLVLNRHRERLGGSSPPSMYEFSVLHHDGTSRIRVIMHVSALTFEGKPATLGTLHDVTVEREREAAMRESEEKYRTLVENVQDVIYRTDCSGNLVMASPSFLSLLGYDSLEECLGKNIADTFWMDPPRRKDFLEALKENGSISGYEVVLKKKDGSPVIIAASSHFYRDRNGVAAGIEGIFHDITAIRKAEEESRLLTTLNDLSPASVIVHTPEGEMLYANQRTFEMHGYTREEFMKLNLHDIDLPESEKRIQERLELLRRTGEASFDVEHYRKDGSTIPLNVTARITRWNNRDVIMSVSIDISEREQAEAAVRESEEKYRCLFENNHAVILVVDPDTGAIADVNPAACMYYGWSREDLTRMNIRDINTLTEEEIRKEMELARDPTRGSFFFRHRRADGSVRDVEVFSGPIRIRGKPFLYSLIFDITSRKIAEAERRESEARLQSVLHGVPLLQFVIDHNHRLISWNQAMEEYSGIPAADVIGTDQQWRAFYDTRRPVLADLIVDGNTDGLYKWYGGNIQRSRYIEGAFEAIDFFPNMGPDGKWLMFTAAPVHDAAGTTIGAVETLEDITDRKHAEEALKESKERFREIVEYSTDVFYRQSMKTGRFEYFSPKVLEVFGYSPNEMLAMSTGDLKNVIHPDDLSSLLSFPSDMVAADERGETMIEREFRFRRKDGVYCWIHGNYTLVRDENGTPAKVIGSLHDVTDRKRAEEGLRESEQKYRGVIENIQDAYIRSDPDGRLAMASPSTAVMYGYESVVEMIGLPIAIFYEEPEKRREVIERLTADHEIRDHEIVFRRKNGQTFTGSVNARLLLDEKDQFAGTEAVIRDVTERRKMENAIREVNRKLNLLNSITRHDLANQMTVLQGYTQIAAMKVSDPEVADLLAKIDASAGIISRQIEFTKTYQELGIYSPGWFRLDEVIERTKPREIRYSDTCANAEIFADPMLERVFFNIFDNATRHGGHVTEIAVWCERVEGNLVIIVEDNGIGIPEDEKEKIFTHGYGNNTGLGLFLAREILAITGITIRETGSRGTGARFEISVPKEAYRYTEMDCPDVMP